MEERIILDRSFFGEREKPILQKGSFEVSLFKYSTGVEALRLSNDKGYVIALPFKGQQIWRAEFLNHPLTMKTTFDEPVDTQEFGFTYGGFLLHCGITAMGNPSPEDTHAQHGELPSAIYNSAYIISGSDENGDYIGFGGEYRYNAAFFKRFTFEPQCRLYLGASTLKMDVRLTNQRATDLEYFYLCHINFRPEDGARLVYSASRKPEDVVVHRTADADLPVGREAEMTSYLDALEKDPSLMDKVDKTKQIYDPEIVFTLKYNKDECGMAHTMQVLNDGYAHYVAHKPEQFTRPLRWIARTSEEDAMGMVLPSTSEHLGYKYSKAHGFDKHLAGYAETEFNFELGILAPDKASQVEEKINEINK